MKTEKGRHITTLLFAFGIFLLSLLTAVFFFISADSRCAQDFSFTTLTDSAKTAGDVIKTRIMGHFTVLESYSVLLSAKKSFDTAAVRRDMANIAETGEFDSLYIALPDGSAFSQSEKRLDVHSDGFFQKSLNGLRGVGKFFGSGEQTGYIILSVPVYKDGAVAAVVFAQLSDTDLTYPLTTSAFDGQSEFFVTDGKGRIVVGGSNHPEGADFLQTVSAARILSGSAADEFANDLANGISSTAIYEVNGAKKYVVYMPLGFEDWMIFNAIPGEPIEAKTNAFHRNIYGLAIVSALFTVLLMAVLASRVKKYSRRLQHEADSLRQSEQRYRVVEEFSEGVVFEANLLTDELRFNKNYQEVFGHPPILKKTGDFAMVQPLVHVDDAHDFARFGQRMLEGDPTGGGIDYRICGIAEQPVWHRLEYRTITNSNGRPTKIIGRVRNIDAEKIRMLGLQIMAESDSLTGLCNNAAFKEKVNHYLQNDGMNGTHILIIIDLDNFKSVNDTFGHAEGDRILQLFGAKIKPLFRTSDVIGRIGGDEFAVFVKDFPLKQAISAKADDICDLVTILGGSHENFTLTCSIGISIYKRDGKNFIELFKKADTALYQAKRCGKGRFAIYDPDFNIMGAHIK